MTDLTVRVDAVGRSAWGPKRNFCARGFDSAASITALTSDDFQDAVIGTVAHPYASLIQAKAGGAATPATPPGSPFGPINDGTLAN